MLLLRGDREPVAAWLRRGQVAARILTLPGWTVVVPAEDLARTAPPYDDALSLLAARPVTSRLRTALGFFAVDGRLVVTVQAEGWRTVHRWLVWEVGTGVVRTPDLTVARPDDLVAAAGVGRRVTGAAVVAAFRDGAPDAAGMLEKLITVLDLPAGGLLDDHEALRLAEVVEPDQKAVRRFDRTVADEAVERAELEDGAR